MNSNMVVFVWSETDRIHSFWREGNLLLWITNKTVSSTTQRLDMQICDSFWSASIQRFCNANVNVKILVFQKYTTFMKYSGRMMKVNIHNFPCSIPSISNASQSSPSNHLWIRQGQYKLQQQTKMQSNNNNKLLQLLSDAQWVNDALRGMEIYNLPATVQNKYTTKSALELSSDHKLLLVFLRHFQCPFW